MGRLTNGGRWNVKTSIGAKARLYPTPVLIIGTYDTQGRPNIMTAAWGGLCRTEPPCLAVSLGSGAYSHGSILSNRAFTVNVPSVALVREADYVGICSGRDRDKFAETGLTPVRSDLVNAPYVQECPLVLECRLQQTVELGSTTQFIGEILDVKVDADALDEQGHPDVTQLQPFSFAPGSEKYYRVGEFIGQAFSIGKRE